MKKEEILDLVFYIASFPSGTQLEEIIEKISKEKLSVSPIFKKVSMRTKAGESLERALKPLEALGLRELVELLVLCKRSGFDVPVALREFAQNLEEQIELEREKRALFILQKYTIILSFSFLIPLILSLVVKTIRFFAVSPLVELSVPAYITLSSLSSLLILKEIEGSFKSFWIILPFFSLLLYFTLLFLPFPF